MSKYWIVVDNTHDGPYTVEELEELELPSDTYAWQPGLPKWTLMKDIPELAHIAEARAAFEAQQALEAEQAQQEVLTAEIADGAVPPSPTEDAEGPQPKAAPVPPPAPEFGYAVPPAYAAATSAQPAFPPPPDDFRCPPAYLAWSIITTILFFLPLGVVAIIYSTRVKGAWALGNFEKARKSSEMAAWFSILAFVVGLIWIPFSMAFSMML